LNAKTRQKIVIAALPVAVIWGAYNLLWTKEKTPVEQPVVASQTVVPVESPRLIPGDPDLQQIKEADWGTDPFKSEIKREAKPADNSKKELKLILSGILFNERSPMAVINKRTVRSGDVIGDARVVTIDRKSVLMEQNGKQFRLKVTKG
jgi:type II secretory pathway component PulC